MYIQQKVQKLTMEIMPHLPCTMKNPQIFHQNNHWDVKLMSASKHSTFTIYWLKHFSANPFSSGIVGGAQPWTESLPPQTVAKVLAVAKRCGRHDSCRHHCCRHCVPCCRPGAASWSVRQTCHRATSTDRNKCSVSPVWRRSTIRNRTWK